MTLHDYPSHGNLKNTVVVKDFERLVSTCSHCVISTHSDQNFIE